MSVFKKKKFGNPRIQREIWHNGYVTFHINTSNSGCQPFRFPNPGWASLPLDVGPLNPAMDLGSAVRSYQVIFARLYAQIY